MRVLHNHGIPEISPKDVFSAIVLSRLLYCAPAWWGFCTAAYIESASRVHERRCKRYGYCDQNTPRISELFNDADDVLYQSVLHRRRTMFSSTCSKIVNQHNTPCVLDHILKNSFRKHLILTIVIFL